MAFRDNCSGSVRKEIVKYENWALNLAQLQQQHLTGSHAPLLPPTHKWHQRAIDANTVMPMVLGASQGWWQSLHWGTGHSICP